MEQYTVTGMSCAACSARVERAVSQVKGVTSCTVSLLTNSMGVEGTAPEEDIIKAVEAAGYGIKRKGADNKNHDDAHDEDVTDKETASIKKRLAASLFFVIILMYFSMGHMMWGMPLPKFFEQNHVAVGLVQLILSAIVMIINQKFFINGFKGIINRSPNMDSLVALGSGAAFIYSTYALFAMTKAQALYDTEAVMLYMEEFYFESAAMILTLISVGKMLEARSKGRTTSALCALMALRAKTAVVIRDGAEVTLPIEQVKKGDVFVVRPGENIPVDGVILQGTGAVDESALTGESIPKDKSAGDNVSAATINKSGFLKCEATRVGEDTTLAQIIKMVEDSAATKAPIAKIADKVSGVFVPFVIAVALITMAAWLIAGEDIGFALARGISVLVISCPCALGLATPVAIMVGNGVGARNGILFKTAIALENTGKTKIVALDKTGTITKGQPEVTDIITTASVSEKELLSYAYSLEKMSEHPLAKAIVKKAEETDVKAYETYDFKALTGNGLTAKCKNSDLTGGSISFVGSIARVPEDISEKAHALALEGKTPILFAVDNNVLGMIAVADVIKEDSCYAVQKLKSMGIKVVMLTGDNKYTAKAIGDKVGVDEVISEVLPDGKESVIRKLKESGRVAMVGDGINDAPALTSADIGIAIGAGVDVAIDAADVVLMNSSLLDVSAAIHLSRRTLINIKENLFWAFIYNVIGIPVAAGVFIHLWGWQLDPMFAAAAMSLSSFCVVTNALRLNFVKIIGSESEKNKIGK